jgi:hypothetical protein
MDAGSVTNKATGTAEDKDAKKVYSNEDTETVTAITIDLVAAAVCINDAPWATFTVTVNGIDGVVPGDVTYSWINVDGGPGNEVVVAGPTALTAWTGALLWPGAAVSGVYPTAIGTGWPGWTESPTDVWTFTDTNEVPNLVLRVSVNPTDEALLVYPAAVLPCAPPPVLNVVKTAESLTTNVDGTIDVTYKAEVTNTGGQTAIYDLKDYVKVDEALSLSATPNPVVVTYVPGNVDSKKGTLETPSPGSFAAFPGATLVTKEELEPGNNEAFRFTLRFDLDSSKATLAGANCLIDDDQGTNTGATNHVDVLVNSAIVDSDEACREFPVSCELGLELLCSEHVPDGVVDLPSLSDKCTVFNVRTECTQRASSLGFRFNAGNCTQSSNTQEAGKFECNDILAPATDGPFRIVISNSEQTWDFLVNPADEFVLTATDGSFASQTDWDLYEGSKMIQTGTFHTSCSQNLFIGDRYGNLEVISFTNGEQGTVESNNEIDLWYTVTNKGIPPINWLEVGDDNATPGDPGDDVLVADGTDDDPVASGDDRVFKRTVLVTGESTYTAFASAENEGDDGDVCGDSGASISILILDPPVPIASCDDDKPKALVFEYVGENCSHTSNSQGRKDSCEDLKALGGAPVQVVYTGKDSKDYKVTPVGETVALNGPVMIEVVNGKNLEDDVKFEIMRGGVVLQKLKIRAKCDVPLNVGDQFGSLILREYYPK